MRTDSRLLIASNRLPFTVARAGDDVRLVAACGGLAAALGSLHQSRDCVWVGWPGDCDGLNAQQLDDLDARLREQRVVPVMLGGAEIVPYYDGVCNSILWPVFHYLLDRLPLSFPDFEMYRAVNERFANAIVREYRDGDLIWIHDYHLMLAPAMVRMRLPEAPIGFFLHTPFPAADVFRVLPWRRELLDGMLGATQLGFQTHRDALNFAETVRALTEYRVERAAVVVDNREVRFAEHPIGIDPVRTASPVRPSPTDDDSGSIVTGGRRLLLGVDRLDYTKGIPRRLAAFERLLDDRPDLRGRIEFLQIAVPSRSHVPSYVSLRQEVDALVGSINARFGTSDWTPLRYLTECLDADALQPLYRAADVMLVTSLRDGMNLVAKEFVLARDDEGGVLILSELAGVAEELHEALLINPYSVEDIARAMAAALAIDAAEGRQRMRALRERAMGRSIATWVDRVTAELTRTPPSSMAVEDCVRSAVRAGIARGDEICVVLQYEGVLVPEVERSWTHRPDAELVELLQALRLSSGVSTHVVTGFPHGVVGRWFDGVLATLWAEHGLWCREYESARWRRTDEASADWTEDVRELLDQFAARCPGAFVEQRGAELVWHFGRADRIHGHTQAQMLGALLREASETLGLTIAETGHALTVRPAGLTLERTLQKLRDGRLETGPVIVFDMPRPTAAVRHALNRGDVLVTVGGRDSGGDLALPTPRAARTLLWDLVNSTSRIARLGAAVHAATPAMDSRAAAS